MEAPPSPLSSRPKRSEVEGSAVPRTSRGNVFRQTATWQSGLLLPFPRRRSTHAGPTLRRLPAIIGRTILEEKRILAVRTGRIRRICLAENLTRPKRVRANLIHQLVRAFVGLREPG